MDFSEYQKACLRTANPTLTHESSMLNWALGICGEAGEVAELIKKNVFHGKDLNLDDVEKEIGDVMYYLASMCNTLGIDFGNAANKNVLKLLERYPDGFVEHKLRKDLIKNNDSDSDGN